MSFEIASALELPFDDGRFDVVLLQHVAMNISDRTRLYREIRRVLKSAGRTALLIDPSFLNPDTHASSYCAHRCFFWVRDSPVPC